RQAWFREAPWDGLKRAEAARAHFVAANHPRGALLAQVFVGMNAWFLGARERAAQELQATLVSDMQFALSMSLRTSFVVGVLVDRGSLAEARREAIRLVESGCARRLPLHEGRGRSALASVLHRLSDLEGAEREVRAALALLTIMPLDRVAAMVTL